MRPLVLALAAPVLALAVAGCGGSSGHRGGGAGTGSQLSTVPDVVGLGGHQAIAALRKHGLSFERKAAWDGHKPGTVFAADPQPGSPVLRGSRVTLVISRGGARVPGVEGLSAEKAMQTLRQAGLRPHVIASAKYNAATAVVTRQNPPAGFGPPRAAVALTVSSNRGALARQVERLWHQQTHAKAPQCTPDPTPGVFDCTRLGDRVNIVQLKLAKDRVVPYQLPAAAVGAGKAGRGKNGGSGPGRGLGHHKKRGTTGSSTHPRKHLGQHCKGCSRSKKKHA